VRVLRHDEPTLFFWFSRFLFEARSGTLPRAESAGSLGSLEKKQHARVGSGNSFELSSTPVTHAQQTELDQAIANRDLEVQTNPIVFGGLIV